MGDSVCPARECELSAMVAMTEAAFNICRTLPLCQILFFMLYCINSFNLYNNHVRQELLFHLFTHKET